MEPEKKSNGAFVGLVIIIIILIIGGIYMWDKNKATQKSILESRANIEAVNSQDASALESLDQDLQNTTIDTSVDFKSVK